jgi:Anticodon binding domain
MLSEPVRETPNAVAQPFTGDDVAAICRERGWLLSGEAGEATTAWCAEAAALLGPRVANRDGLARLLSLVFAYDAQAILSAPENHAVLAHEGSREVIRLLVLEVLGGGEVDSDCLKRIVTQLKERLPYRGREIFFPLRMVLAGRAGEGEMDRVILLVDRAARIAGLAPVKTARERVMEFCAALD